MPGCIIIVIMFLWNPIQDYVFKQIETTFCTSSNWEKNAVEATKNINLACGQGTTSQ